MAPDLQRVGTMPRPAGLQTDNDSEVPINDQNPEGEAVDPPKELQPWGTTMLMPATGKRGPRSMLLVPQARQRWF